METDSLNIDPMLAILARGANEGSIHLMVTLSLNGVTISGTLCSREEYDVLNESLFEQYADAESVRVIRLLNEAKTAGEQDEPTSAAEYLHLKSWRFLGGSWNDMPFRCKVSSVGGFMLAGIALPGEQPSAIPTTTA